MTSDAPHLFLSKLGAILSLRKHSAAGGTDGGRVFRVTKGASSAYLCLTFIFALLFCGTKPFTKAPYRQFLGFSPAINSQAQVPVKRLDNADVGSFWGCAALLCTRARLIMDYVLSTGAHNMDCNRVHS